MAAELPTLPLHAELLPGWDEPWVVDERERLHQLLLHALEARARLLLARGDPAAALDAALRAVAADPLRESAHALVVEVHLSEGNRVEGRRQVERCRALLQAELGVDASRLLALVATPRLDTRTRASRPSSSVVRSRLATRSRCWAVLGSS